MILLEALTTMSVPFFLFFYVVFKYDGKSALKPVVCMIFALFIMLLLSILIDQLFEPHVWAKASRGSIGRGIGLGGSSAIMFAIILVLPTLLAVKANVAYWRNVAYLNMVIIATVVTLVFYKAFIA
jgi:hypothetical protein